MNDCIVIVDDVPNNLRLLSNILTNHGYRVRLAPNGKHALKTIKKEPPDLVLLDIQLPDMNGFDVCKILNKDEVTCDIPIIFLSAANDVKVKVRAFSAGGLDYITKPFQVEEVIARVQTHLKLQHIQTELEKEIQNSKRYEKMLEFEQQKLKHQNDQLEKVFTDMKEDMKIAGRIQHSLLPIKKNLEGIKAQWIFRPCTSIGGDIFNFFQFDENHIGFYLLDVSGHGIHAALLSVTLSKFLSTDGLAYNLLKNDDGKITPPAEVLNLLNIKFQLDAELHQYFTILYGIIDTKSGLLTFSSAGQTPMIHWGKNRKPEYWECCAPPIGLVDIFSYEETSRILEPGDLLILYSDGFLDLMSRKKIKNIGLEEFIEMLGHCNRDSISTVCTDIEEFIEESINSDVQKDDITVLFLQI